MAGQKIIVGSTWQEVANNSVTSVTFQNQGQQFLEIAFGESDTLPDETDFGYLYTWSQGEKNKTLADLAVAAANNIHMFARCVGGKETRMFLEVL